MITYKCQMVELTDINRAAKGEGWVLTGVNPDSVKVYPELKLPDDSPHYPEKIRALFVELQEDIQMRRTPARIVTGCRSVLEVALKQLGYEKGNLQSRIEKARADGLLTEAMKNWAHRVRLDGNEAVHELEATDEQAQEFVSFLRLLLEILFVLPERIKQLQLAP
ncbi:TPA: DUF4145 domain-containing protein [Enterobacter kobei]|nr:DUF4145 domain-containing protein [Enterobacter kobei]